MIGVRDLMSERAQTLTLLPLQWDINARSRNVCNLPSSSQATSLWLDTLSNLDGSPPKSLCTPLTCFAIRGPSNWVRRCLHLWDYDRSMTDALEVAKMFLLPVDNLTAMFPCQGEATHFPNC